MVIISRDFAVLKVQKLTLVHVDPEMVQFRTLGMVHQVLDHLDLIERFQKALMVSLDVQ